MKKLIVIVLSTILYVSTTCGQQGKSTYENYGLFFMNEGDSIGKKFHVIDIPLDTAVYLEGNGDAILDINGDGFKDAIGKIELGLKAWNSSKCKNDSNLNQLCIYINEGDSVFRYKTRSAFVLSDYYMGWYSILSYGNDGFCIKTVGQQSDWNKYYLYFQYDKKTDSFYLVKSLVQAEYDEKEKKKVEEKIYDENTRIPFEKVNFDVYFQHILEAIPQREEWVNIKEEKSILYDNNLKPTRKYLIKDDQVRLDKEVKDFYKITYFTKDSKSEGWIKKSDVE